ncbi:MAG: hypothetical protein AAF065_03890 [Verrucomicrobiota bacterium]
MSYTPDHPFSASWMEAFLKNGFVRKILLSGFHAYLDISLEETPFGTLSAALS